MKKVILLFLLLFTPLFAEDLVVTVSSESSLSPLFLAPLPACPSTNISNEHLKNLISTLTFDLNQNGSTTVVSSEDLLKLAKKENNWKTFDCHQWKKLGVAYVIKMQLEGATLHLAAFSVEKNSIKGFDLPLTGKIEDRASIHHVSDTIHELFFGQKGIASKKILFTNCIVSSKGHGLTDVWEADYDGVNAKKITNDGVLCVTPTFIPPKPGSKAKQFLYVSYKIGQPKIFLGNLDQPNATRLTFLKGNQLMPTLSSKRNLLAFISDITGNPELFIQSFDPQQGLIGKPRMAFAAPKGAQGSPTFSPDGSSLAFVSNKDGAPRIYLLKLSNATQTASAPTMISKLQRENTCPAWSPNGKWIAYSALTKGVRQIWLYDVDKKKETQLTFGKEHKENPAWAPNSFHLLYNTSSTNSGELYLINLNTRQPIKISKVTGEKRFPAWEP